MATAPSGSRRRRPSAASMRFWMSAPRAAGGGPRRRQRPASRRTSIGGVGTHEVATAVTFAQSRSRAPGKRPDAPFEAQDSKSSLAVGGGGEGGRRLFGVGRGDGCPFYRLTCFVENRPAHAAPDLSGQRPVSPAKPDSPRGRERENPQRLHDRKV